MVPIDAGTDGTEDTEGDGVEMAWRSEPLTEGCDTEATGSEMKWVKKLPAIPSANGAAR